LDAKLQVFLHDRLLFNLHFVKQITGASQFVDDKKCVSDIEYNVAAAVGVEYQVAHGPFPATVEIDSN